MASVSIKIAKKLVSTSRLWNLQRPPIASLTAEGPLYSMIVINNELTIYLARMHRAQLLIEHIDNEIIYSLENVVIHKS